MELKGWDREKQVLIKENASLLADIDKLKAELQSVINR